MPIVARAATAEYTSLTRSGRPITVPVSPYLGEDGRTLDVSTGLAYPAKAERARANPRVSLLYANTDRYIRAALAKYPEAYKGQPAFLLRRLDWSFARLWIAVTPLRIWWWESKALDHPPGAWAAPPGTAAPPSAPAPPGERPPAWLASPADWRPAARDAVARLDQRDLSWVDAAGFPLSIPVLAAEEHAQGFRLQLGHHPPALPDGPANLTFHQHPEAFTGQENRTFLGQIAITGGEGLFRVERLLADWSLAGNTLTKTLDFLGKGRQLRPRLKAEAARRGQPVPRVRLPGDR
jgi:hypothetical protein